jgi:hypothetical protein
VGRQIPDEDDELELPGNLDGDEEAPGIAEADELALAEIDDGPEEIGLDTETGAIDPFEFPIDPEEDLSLLDDGPLEEVVAEVDAEGEEGGWLEESEGSSEPLGEDLVDDDEDDEYSLDDGGLEGVDDPMLDDIEEQEDLLGEDDDEDEPAREAHDELDDDTLPEPLQQTGSSSAKAC